MKIGIGYGETTQEVSLRDESVLGVLLPKQVDASINEDSVVIDSLSAPIGSLPLSQMVGKGKKVAIITSDITRPLPSYKVIPHVLKQLLEAGVKQDDVVVVFALGIHRKQTEAEMIKLVGREVYETVRCVDSDTEDVVRMGVTSMGTLVDIFAPVANADVRIGIGNIEYHYFAGYSGGVKALMPGVSTREAIGNNHSMMVRDEAAQGKLEGNPVRMDMEEALGICPLHFIVNVVLDEQKNIVHCVSGDVIAAHREGCKLLDDIYSVKISERADIVIASQGGYPKDLNLYQLQKALDNAKFAVKKGGIIILAGTCKEGLGEDVFEEWMMSAKTHKELIERIQADFVLGGHKAAAIAMVLEQAEIYLVSEMEDSLVEDLFMRPFSSVQAAYEAAASNFEDATVIVMPYAGSVLPVDGC